MLAVPAFLSKCILSLVNVPLFTSHDLTRTYPFSQHLVNEGNASVSVKQALTTVANRLRQTSHTR